MKKIVLSISMVALAIGSFSFTSCGCCTGEASAPALRPLPTFGEIPTVDYHSGK